MKQVKMFIIGIILTILGVMMFLQNLTFKDPSNTGMFGSLMGALFGDTSPKALTGALFVIIFVSLLIFAFSPSVFTMAGFLLTIVITVLIAIGSLDITIAEMSGLKVGIIGGLIMIGIGMTSGAVVKLTTDNTKKEVRA